MTANKPRPSKGRSAANPSNYSQLYKQSEQNILQSAVTPSAATTQAVATPHTSEQVDWKAEYGYVFKDLRYLLIVSAILFVAIVVLGFFL
ncbi:MAG TPA: hypothetical protein DCL15_00580 [Chloroflexi bacterium]|nr:hypothetical protein [Chloroflexota bacterium]HHW84951.1 hypothetical protein [Chloroflexota bacterium]